MARLLIFSFMGLLMAGSAFAQKPFVAIELDPAPFVLSGYSVSLKVAPPQWKRFTLMGSVFSAHMPDAMMRKSNRDNGWTGVHIMQSAALFVDYYPSATQRGWHTGPNFFWYDRSMFNEVLQLSGGYKSGLYGWRAGYVWQPVRKAPIYLNPWLLAGWESAFPGQAKQPGFQTNGFSWILAVHVGWGMSGLRTKK